MMEDCFRLMKQPIILKSPGLLFMPRLIPFVKMRRRLLFIMEQLAELVNDRRNTFRNGNRKAAWKGHGWARPNEIPLLGGKFQS